MCAAYLASEQDPDTLPMKTRAQHLGGQYNTSQQGGGHSGILYNLKSHFLSVR